MFKYENNNQRSCLRAGIKQKTPSQKPAKRYSYIATPIILVPGTKI